MNQKNSFFISFYILIVFNLFFTNKIYAHEVKINDGILYINNKETFLYGGDLHYFRVRDKDFSEEKTYKMWSDTLDKMKIARMNLVTTYIPWDYHEVSENNFDFSKSKSIQTLLKMIEDRNMFIIIKIGPFITAEWPNGFGSFGSVPKWWKEKYKKSLALKSNKNYFSFSPFDNKQVQPTILDKQFLLSTEKWYNRVIDEVKPFIGKCIVGIQIDNETNLFWGERYGDIDYSKTALNFYYTWLKNKYKDIKTLNKSYNSNFDNFYSVTPPNNPPNILNKFKQDYFSDWYEVGQDYIKTYLLKLKTILEKKLEKEFQNLYKDKLFFLVNDSPFGLSVGNYTKNIILHNTIKKREIANIGLDFYPKQLVFNEELMDQPFQVDYFTKLVNNLTNNNFVFGTELQGGFYDIPFLGRAKVKPEATDQLLARSIGHGLKGASFYVIRDGLNYDNSTYNYDSAINYEGKTTKRFEIMKKWGNFLEKYGEKILKAKEINNSIAILQNMDYQTPSINHNQNFYTIEYPALYGSLLNENINPELLDVYNLKEEYLSKYKLIFYPNPDHIEEKIADFLEKYVSNGGILVNLLNKGKKDFNFKENILSKIFNCSDDYKESKNGVISIKYKKGYLYFIEENFYKNFNSPEYYKEKNLKSTLFINSLMNKIEETAIVKSNKERIITWAKKIDNYTFIFIVNDNNYDNLVNLKINDIKKLEIKPEKSYKINFAFFKEKEYFLFGSNLVKNGLNIKLPAFSTQIMILEDTN
ncbi:MAG: alpha-amylase family protein [Candidatus Sericytochromatia bacterium]